MRVLAFKWGNEDEDGSEVLKEQSSVDVTSQVPVPFICGTLTNLVITVPADGLARDGARPSAGTVPIATFLYQWLQCISNGDTAVLHQAIDIVFTVS